MTNRPEPLDDADENLYRQVHPSWIHDGRVSSQAFTPSPKDEGQLSVDRGSHSTPQESFERFINNGFSSIGVWAVTVGETCAAGLKAYPDPDPEGWANPAHAYVHFSDLPPKKAKKKGQVLAAHACDRGCLYESPHAGPTTK